MKPLSQCRTQLPRHGIREIMVRASQIHDAIHLEVGEPNCDTPLHIQKAALHAIRDGYFHYTHNLGLLSLREAFCQFFYKTYGLTVTPEQVAVTPGAVTALAVSLLAIVDSGEEVLIPDPSWPNYRQMIASQGSVPVPYELRPENGFQPILANLEKLVTSKTKAIIINSPSNPTGAVFDQQMMAEIMHFSRKHDLYVISDEIYDQIVYEGQHIPAMTYDQDGRTVSIYGASKTFAMTGWRIGLALAAPVIISVIEKTIEPLVSCANTIAQKAAEAAYKGPQDFAAQMRETYKNRRDIVYDIFQKEQVKAFKPKGAFYMMVDLAETGLSPDEIAVRLLDEEKVAVGPGFTFGSSSQQMIRISLASDTTSLLEGARRICRFVDRHRKNEFV